MRISNFLAKWANVTPPPEYQGSANANAAGQRLPAQHQPPPLPPRRLAENIPVVQQQERERQRGAFRRQSFERKLRDNEAVSKGSLHMRDARQVQEDRDQIYLSHPVPETADEAMALLDRVNVELATSGYVSSDTLKTLEQRIGERFPDVVSEFRAHKAAKGEAARAESKVRAEESLRAQQAAKAEATAQALRAREAKNAPAYAGTAVERFANGNTQDAPTVFTQLTAKRGTPERVEAEKNPVLDAVLNGYPVAPSPQQPVLHAVSDSKPDAAALAERAKAAAIMSIRLGQHKSAKEAFDHYKPPVRDMQDLRRVVVDTERNGQYVSPEHMRKAQARIHELKTRRPPNLPQDKVIAVATRVAQEVMQEYGFRHPANVAQLQDWVNAAIR